MVNQQDIEDIIIVSLLTVFSILAILIAFRVI